MHKFNIDNNLQRKRLTLSPVTCHYPACLQQKKNRCTARFFWQFLSKITSFIILLSLLTPKTYAQQATDYAIHANIIYHFTKYIDWPPDKKTGSFIIGVTGDTPLYDELKKSTANKMVGNQKIVIVKFSSSASSFNCNILFISDEESESMKKIASVTASSPTLLVSESEGLAKKGSCINFIIVSDRLKLEINKKNIGERGLGIASELLQLGKIVK